MAESKKAKAEVEEAGQAPGNDDLELTADGSEVARSSEVAAKTTPNLREETSTDNGRYFERDFTITMWPGEEPTEEMLDRGNVQVRMEAEARGLIPTGAPSRRLAETFERGGKVHRRWIYRVPVELNGPHIHQRVDTAVSEQPPDTPVRRAEDPTTAWVDGHGPAAVERKG